jgi:hypothetical protein
MTAVTIWLIPALLVVAVGLFATGGIMIAASRDRATSRGFTVLWIGLGSLIAAAATYVLPMLVLGLAARPA